MGRISAVGTGLAFLLAAAPVAAQYPLPDIPHAPLPAGVARVAPLQAGIPDPCPLDCGDPCAALCGDPCAPGVCPPPEPPCPPEPRVPWRLRWDPCQPPPPFWVSAEYLLWHMSDAPRIGNLAASGPAQTLSQLVANPAALTPADTGGGRFDMASGLRVTAGHWFGPYNRLGAEVGGFFLERRNDTTTLLSSPTGSPAIVRPFTTSGTGTPDFAVVSLPGVAAGQLAVQTTSQFWGAETNALLRAVVGPENYFTPLVGIRYLGLEEGMAVIQHTTLIGRGTGGFGGRPIGPPQGVVISDRFDTRSQFFGGQLGARFGTRYNRLDAGAYVKVGLGWAHHSSEAAGSTALTGPGGGAVLPGGLLVAPSNAIRTNADDLAVVPEAGLQLGYEVAPWLRLTAGYSALWWSRVVRPGAQVPTEVNPGRVPASLQFGRPGQDVPPSPLVRDGLWINGVQFGATLRF